jgi:RNA polymerase sigma-70 factor (ECF subfamily)
MGCPPSPSLDGPHDVALMARIAVRDQQAFRQLAERYVERIIAVAQRILGNAAEADEVAQETLFRVWQHADRWDPARAELAVWIYRITCNLSIDRTRRRIFRPLDPADDIADTAPLAIDTLVAREAQTQLAAALAALPARQRAAITLFYHEELSGEATAAALGVSVPGVWSLLLRGRRALARALGTDRTMRQP